MIRHLVFLNYADTVPRHARDGLMAELAALKDELDGIEDFGTRSNLSPEASLIHGLTEMFWFDFRDVAARDAYLANETHKSIGARLFASLEGGATGIFVCDIEL